MSNFKPLFGTQLNRSHPLARGLVGAWLFNENSGIYLADYSGNENRGTIAYLAEPATTSSGWNPGPLGNCLIFNGSSNRVNLGASPELAVTNNFTFVITLKSNDATGNAYIYGRDGGASATQHAIITGYVDNNIEVYASNYSGDDPRTGSQLAIPDTTTFHTYAYSYNGETWAGYRDGVPIFSLSKSFSLAATASSGRCALGSSAASSDFSNIALSNFYVFDRGLSAEEIAYLYAFPFTMFESVDYPAWMREAAAYGESLLGVKNETGQISEGFLRSLGLVRLTDETGNTSESFLRNLGFLRITDESGNISETIIRNLNFLRISNESQQISESFLRNLGLIRNYDESIQISESKLRTLNLIRIFSELVSTSETFNQLRNLVRIKNEVQQLEELLLRIHSMVRITDETETIGDQLVRVLGMVRTRAEVQQISESSLRLIGLTRIFTENVSIIESFKSLNYLIRIASESMSISETFKTLKGFVRIYNETVTISEFLSRLMSLVKICNESESIPESFIRQLNLIRTKNESETITETFFGPRILLAIFNEGVRISESIIVSFSMIVLCAVVKIALALQGTFSSSPTITDSTQPTISPAILGDTIIKPED